MTADITERAYATTVPLPQFQHTPELLSASPGDDRRWRFTDFLACGWCGTRLGTILSHWEPASGGQVRHVCWRKPPGFRAESGAVWELGRRARRRLARGQKLDYDDRNSNVDLPALARCPVCQNFQVLDAAGWILSADRWRQMTASSGLSRL